MVRPQLAVQRSDMRTTVIARIMKRLNERRANGPIQTMIGSIPVAIPNTGSPTRLSRFTLESEVALLVARPGPTSVIAAIEVAIVINDGDALWLDRTHREREDHTLDADW